MIVITDVICEKENQPKDRPNQLTQQHKEAPEVAKKHEGASHVRPSKGPKKVGAKKGGAKKDGAKKEGAKKDEAKKEGAKPTKDHRTNAQY